MAKVKSEEESRHYWNTLAEAYEKYYIKVSLHVNTIILPLLSIDPSHTVAECGCGTGTGIQLLFHYYPTLSKILANDLSDQMIQIAQSKNFPNTELRICNNENLPYDSESCDRYVSNLSLHFVEHPENMLKEAYRVLKIGGIAVLTVWGKPSENNILKVMASASIKAGVEIPKERSPFYLNDQELLNGLVRGAGFNNVRSFYGSVPVLMNTADQFLQLVDSREDIINLKRDNGEVYERMMNDLRENFDRIFGSGGFLTFEFLAVVGEKTS